MSKKRILVVSAWITGSIVLLLLVMAVLGLVFADSLVTNSYSITDPFYHVRVVTDTADVFVLPAEDRMTEVDCLELSKAKHAVSVKDGTLTIEIQDSRKWYELMGIHFSTPKVSVYLPSGVYSNLVIEGDTGDVEIAPDFRFANMNIAVNTGNVTNRASSVGDMDLRTSTGDICVEEVSAATMSFSVSTGDISASSINCTEDLSVHVSTGNSVLHAVRCKNLLSTGETGSSSLGDVIAEETFSIKQSTGDVHLDGCDAASLQIQTDTGDVSGSLLSEKVFIARTDTGSVDVPQTNTGGTCEITTDTGDISISIQ